MHVDVLGDRLGVAGGARDQVRVGAGRDVLEAVAAVAVGGGVERTGRRRVLRRVAAERDLDAGERRAAVAVGHDAAERALAGDPGRAGPAVGDRVGVVGVAGGRVPAHPAVGEHLPDPLGVLTLAEHAVGLQERVAVVEEARLRRGELERRVGQRADAVLAVVLAVRREQLAAQLPHRLADDLAVVVRLRPALVDLAVVLVADAARGDALEQAVAVEHRARTVDRLLAAHAGLEQVRADPHLAGRVGVGHQPAADQVVE